MIKQQKIKKYFIQKEKLILKNPDYLKQLSNTTNNIWQNDLGERGDVTTNFLIKKNTFVRAAIYAKERGIIAGLEEVAWFLQKNKIKIKKYSQDGKKIKKNEVILELKGKIKDILKTERIALNILQRMSGIATTTDYLIRKTKHRVLVCPTRKTIINLLDKKAVAVAGGGTHRLGLHDFVLIKDNHLAFLGADLEKKIKTLNTKKIFWEIEVKNIDQAFFISRFNPPAILFDNLKPKKIRKSIALIKQNFPNIIFEASGNINKKNIKKYSKTGVDIISLGSLTHSVQALDISLDLL